MKAWNKRGVATWVSYVLLTLLVVSLGAIVLNWTKSTTTQTVEDIVARGEALTFCQETGFVVLEHCQDTQTLNINVTNNNNRKVDALIVRGFDIYNNPQGGQKNISLDPEKTKNVVVVKQGVFIRAEVMPIIVVGRKRVVCQSRKVAIEDIAFCK